MEVDRSKVSLSWRAPKDDGGSEIFNYVIEYRAEGAFKWRRANVDHVPDRKYTVRGLEEDTLYEFRVAAENKAGVGPYSESTGPVKAEEHVGELYLVGIYFIEVLVNFVEFFYLH